MDQLQDFLNILFFLRDHKVEGSKKLSCGPYKITYSKTNQASSSDEITPTEKSNKKKGWTPLRL